MQEGSSILELLIDMNRISQLLT